MTLETVAMILSVFGMCFGSYLIGYGVRGIHDSNRSPPDPPPHTGWRKK